MPTGLKRYYGKGHLHFVTCSCYRQRAFLGTTERRDLFLAFLEEAREEYGFRVVGFVVMPEHFHLLMSEPDCGTVSTVLQVVKQRFARKVNWVAGSEQQIFQRRFYDFNVYSARKVEEKVAYIHLNPVRRGLAESAVEWVWSSAGFYAGFASALVTVEPVSARRVALYGETESGAPSGA
jgi:putative transposase